MINVLKIKQKKILEMKVINKLNIQKQKYKYIKILECDFFFIYFFLSFFLHKDFI